MFKEYLKQYRIKHNLSQENMSKLVGCCQSYYSQIETGIRKPGFKMIDKLSKVLNVEPEFIRSLL